jgi:hypothetical protein
MTRSHLSSAGQRAVESALAGELVSLAALEVVRGPHGPFYHAASPSRGLSLARFESEAQRFVKAILQAGWVPCDVEEDGTPNVLVWGGERDERAKLPPDVRAVLQRAERDQHRELAVEVAPYALTLEDGRPVAPIDARYPCLFSGAVSYRLNEYEGSVRVAVGPRTVGYFRVLPAWAGAKEDA